MPPDVRGGGRAGDDRVDIVERANQQRLAMRLPVNVDDSYVKHPVGPDRQWAYDDALGVSNAT